MTTPVIAVQKAGAIIAAGPAIRDQPVEMIACIEREPPQGAGIVGADAAFEPRLVTPHPDMHLPAVPPRCAPSHRAAFEQHYSTEERSVGKERVSTCRSRGSPYH